MSFFRIPSLSLCLLVFFLFHLCLSCLFSSLFPFMLSSCFCFNCFSLFFGIFPLASLHVCAQGNISCEGEQSWYHSKYMNMARNQSLFLVAALVLTETFSYTFEDTRAIQSSMRFWPISPPASSFLPRGKRSSILVLPISYLTYGNPLSSFHSR